MVDGRSPDSAPPTGLSAANCIHRHGTRCRSGHERGRGSTPVHERAREKVRNPACGWAGFQPFWNPPAAARLRVRLGGAAPGSRTSVGEHDFLKSHPPVYQVCAKIPAQLAGFLLAWPSAARYHPPDQGGAGERPLPFWRIGSTIARARSDGWSSESDSDRGRAELGLVHVTVERFGRGPCWAGLGNEAGTR